MKTLEELLIDKDFLSLKRKIQQKFSFLDCHDIESVYYYSIWQSLEKFDKSKNLKIITLFYKIFYFECLTLCREYLKNKNLLSGYTKSDSEFDSFSILLEDLSDSERNLLLQRYLEQKTLDEISKELEISISMVSKKINSLLKKLKEE